MKEVATFGMGCFWHAQSVFDCLDGVLSSRVGYSGGKRGGYEDAEEFGNAEVVEVTFDSSKISYGELLEVFWREHDATSVDRQGLDVGKRYRSVIFYHSEEQKRIAERSRDEAEKRLGEKVATEIVAAGDFYEAEEEHQKYFEKHGKVCRR